MYTQILRNLCYRQNDRQSGLYLEIIQVFIFCQPHFESPCSFRPVVDILARADIYRPNSVVNPHGFSGDFLNLEPQGRCSKPCQSSSVPNEVVLRLDRLVKGNSLQIAIMLVPPLAMTESTISHPTFAQVLKRLNLI